MIVVLGPAELAEALVATAPGELVVGAKDDERLGQGVVVAAEVASALPLPARACIVAAWNDPVLACEAIRAAKGSLSGARLFVVGDPPPGMEIAVWNIQMGRTGAVPARDLDELRDLLEGQARADESPGVAGAASNGHGHPEGRAAGGKGATAERRAMRPGAPEAAAWRAALRAAPTGRLTKILGRRKLTDAPLPEARLDTTIRRPLHTGCRSIAILSPKGGVGKTTLTYLVGSVLARVRRERVLVVDTNPDFGTLADLAPAIVPATVSDLLRDLDAIEGYGDLSQYTTTTETGMQILSAPQDPVEMVRLGRDGYQTVSELLHRHYDLVIYDCGTGFLDELTQFALRRVDHVVLVTTPSLVTTKIVVGAVDHLMATGFDPTRTTLAVNMVRRDDLLDRRRLRVAMTGRIGGSVEVPFDQRMQHAMDGGEFQYAGLAHATRLAAKRLAAAVVGRMPAREPAPEVDGSPAPGAEQRPQLQPLPGWGSPAATAAGTAATAVGGAESAMDTEPSPAAAGAPVATVVAVETGELATAEAGGHIATEATASVPAEPVVTETEPADPAPAHMTGPIWTVQLEPAATDPVEPAASHVVEPTATGTSEPAELTAVDRAELPATEPDELPAAEPAATAPPEAAEDEPTDTPAATAPHDSGPPEATEPAPPAEPEEHGHPAERNGRHDPAAEGTPEEGVPSPAPHLPHPEFPAWPTMPAVPDPAEGPPVSRYSFTVPHNGAPAATYVGPGARVGAGVRGGRRLAFDWEPDDTPET